MSSALPEPLMRTVSAAKQLLENVVKNMTRQIAGNEGMLIGFGRAKGFLKVTSWDRIRFSSMVIYHQ
jgi:hypothetical protein